MLDSLSIQWRSKQHVFVMWWYIYLIWIVRFWGLGSLSDYPGQFGYADGVFVSLGYFWDTLWWFNWAKARIQTSNSCTFWISGELQIFWWCFCLPGILNFPLFIDTLWKSLLLIFANMIYTQRKFLSQVRWYTWKINWYEQSTFRGIFWLRIYVEHCN